MAAPVIAGGAGAGAGGGGGGAPPPDDRPKRIAVAALNILGELNDDIGLWGGTLLNLNNFFEEGTKFTIAISNAQLGQAGEALFKTTAAGILIITGVYFNYAFKKVLIITQIAKNIFVITQPERHTNSRRTEWAKLSYNIIDLTHEVYSSIPMIFVAKVTAKVALQAIKAAHEYYDKNLHIEAVEAIVVGLIVGFKGSQKIAKLFPYKAAEPKAEEKPVEKPVDNSIKEEPKTEEKPTEQPVEQPVDKPIDTPIKEEPVKEEPLPVKEEPVKEEPVIDEMPIIGEKPIPPTVPEGMQNPYLVFPQLNQQVPAAKSKAKLKIKP